MEPKLYEAAIQFLKRTTLKGDEAEAFVQVIQFLKSKQTEASRSENLPSISEEN